MSAGTLRSAVTEHPHLLGVTLAIALQLAAVAPAAASGCAYIIFGP